MGLSLVGLELKISEVRAIGLLGRFIQHREAGNRGKTFEWYDF